MTAATTPYVFLDDSLSGRKRLYREPVARFRAWSPDEVQGALAGMERARAHGLYLAGYAGYELGYALEPRLAPLLPANRTAPLIDFAAFKGFSAEDPAAYAAPGILTGLTPGWDAADYAQRFDAVLAYIAAGDVYQINLTFPLEGRFSGDPAGLYRELKTRQPVAYGGIVSLGPEVAVSLSPELFFEVADGVITTKPMKGTAARASDAGADAAIAAALSRDAKNRAENLMIVDLLRNDISRIAEAGSVRVPELYAVESYPTVHQMTSTVTGRLLPGLSFAALFGGLFPCGSVTGAPKIRAMEIIHELEAGPRGIYCGAIGHADPDGAMRFNVAIRTVTLFPDGRAVANIGSGVVADSTAEEEYAECLLKARFLRPA